MRRLSSSPPYSSRATAVVLLAAASCLVGGCRGPAPLQDDREARAFRAMHEAIAALESGHDPEGIENRIIDAENVGLVGPCHDWFDRQIQGARTALALLCENDPEWRHAAEELRAELHMSSCLSAHAGDPAHGER